MKHYMVMNGNIGCIPDNVAVHDDKESAIKWALFLFDDYHDPKALREELEDNGIFYFESPEWGADYIELAVEGCIGIENGCEYHDYEDSQ